MSWLTNRLRSHAASTPKFSDTVFTLLQKTHEAFIGTGGIAQKFVDDMATAALNFIQDTTTYEAELSASDGMAFAAGLAHIPEQIADLIKEASTLELTYEGAQKKFAGILERVGKEVKEYLDTQSIADCTTFMDESFDSLCKFSDAFNVSPFIPVIVGMAITSPLAADFPMGECVTLPPEDIPFASYIRCHGGVGADGTAQLFGLTKCHCTGGTGTVEANTEDWYQGNGPNSRVRPRIECGPNPAEAEAGQGGANAVEERSIGGPVIQDSYTHPCFHRTLHEKTLHPRHLRHPWRRNTALLRARTPILAARWLPYWHNFNKASIVDREMHHLRTCRPRILW